MIEGDAFTEWFAVRVASTTGSSAPVPVPGVDYVALLAQATGKEPEPEPEPEPWRVRAIRARYGPEPEPEGPIGRTVEGFELVGGDAVLTLSGGMRLVGVPEGDCCASCWIDELVGAWSIIGGKLVKYEYEWGEATTRPGPFRELADLYESRESEAGDRFVWPWVQVVTVEHADGTIMDAALFCKVEHNGYYGGDIRWRVER